MLASRRLTQLSLLLAASQVVHAQPKTTIDAETYRRQVEADWLRQAEVRDQSQDGKPPTTAEDATGGCDGVKNGLWGFHTNRDAHPWWQVDLGEVRSLRQVVIYNRCDGGVSARAAHLKLTLSTDGETWRQVYQHDGSPFLGFTDHKPLRVNVSGWRARFVRVQLPTSDFLHLDEVEVYGEGEANLALHQPADQSSVSQWSVRHVGPRRRMANAVKVALARANGLLSELRTRGLECGTLATTVAEVRRRWRNAADDDDRAQRQLYIQLRRGVRRQLLADPELDFDAIVFAKRAPGQFSHMSDQYYGWWSRPGGGLYVLRGFKQGRPQLTCLTSHLPPGNVLRPELSHDGRRILFAWCRYNPHVAGIANKVDKAAIPEECFYHLFEVGVDGGGFRQLTHGRYDDFDGRYLPDGRIVFLSTRRGQFIAATPERTQQTATASLPDCYVRCGGGARRPVAVYTLHVMDADGDAMRCISPFENFEWTPAVGADGCILYSRWDYVDRNNMPYMSLWSTRPDGGNPRLVYGNFTRSPYAVFEARPVPGSEQIIATASAHHSITAGSLVLIDPARASEGEAALTRLTPEVCFPEVEGWPDTYFINPYPLSVHRYLTAWSDRPLARQGGLNPVNATGVYLLDSHGNLELLHRDPNISSMYPLPLRPRPQPPLPAPSTSTTESTGRFLVVDVRRGLPDGIAVKRLRIIGVPPKVQPQMNKPRLGLTRDDPGKFVLGDVPVEDDGSAYFRAPAGVPLLFQALDSEGMAVQTMRTVTSLLPGQTLSCVGCHESRHAAPINRRPAAAGREPSAIRPAPEGAWPLRFDSLVQPVLDRLCVSCHRPGGGQVDLTLPKSYATLVDYGKPALREHVLARYRAGRSVPGRCAARTSPLLRLLSAPGGHHGVRLDEDARTRLVLWLDTYGYWQGSFSEQQEQRLLALKRRLQPLLCEANR